MQFRSKSNTGCGGLTLQRVIRLPKEYSSQAASFPSIPAVVERNKVTEENKSCVKSIETLWRPRCPGICIQAWGLTLAKMQTKFPVSPPSPVYSVESSVKYLSKCAFQAYPAVCMPESAWDAWLMTDFFVFRIHNNKNKLAIEDSGGAANMLSTSSVKTYIFTLVRLRNRLSRMLFVAQVCVSNKHSFAKNLLQPPFSTLQ
jgi:hypothetical protein